MLALCRVLPTFFALIHADWSTLYTIQANACTAVAASGKIARFDAHPQRIPRLLGCHRHMTLEVAALHCRTICH